MQKIIPITLLTGYLGSGKTTLLNYILNNQQGYKVAVIVNDIGEVNIDANLLAKDGLVKEQDNSLVPLSNGCICCTLSEDLMRQIAELAGSEKFDYILIEASGVCEPVPIVQTIQVLSDSMFHYNLPVAVRLDNVVSVVDACRFVDEFCAGKGLLNKNLNEDDIENLIIQQVEFCNKIVINKANDVTKEQLEEIKAVIKALQSEAEILTANYGVVDLAKILNTNSFDFDKASMSASWIKELNTSTQEIEERESKEEEYDHHHHDHDCDCHEHHHECHCHDDEEECHCNHDCDCGDDCHCDEDHKCSEDCHCGEHKHHHDCHCHDHEDCDCHDEECHCNHDCDCGDDCDCDEDHKCSEDCHCGEHKHHHDCHCHHHDDDCDCHCHDEEDDKHHHDHKHEHKHHHHHHNCSCGKGETMEYGISTFVYLRRKPLNRAKFEEFTENFPKQIIRSKGVVWFSNDEENMYMFEQAGRQKGSSNVGPWVASLPQDQIQEILLVNKEIREDWKEDIGDRIVKLVIIGKGMDKKEIIKKLDDCLE